MSKDITLGILGSGQLGTELVRSAKKIGISKIIVLSDDKDGPAQNFCDEYIYSDYKDCLLYTSPSPRDLWISRMPSSA